MGTQPDGRGIPIVDDGEPVAEIHWWCGDDSPVAEFAAEEFPDATTMIEAYQTEWGV